MILLNNKPVISLAGYENRIVITDSINAMDSWVYMDITDVPEIHALTYLEIVLPKQDGNPGTDIILRRYVWVHDILKTSLKDEDVICKVIFREAKDKLRYQRLLNNANVMHIGGKIVADSLGVDPTYLGDTLDGWTGTTDPIDEYLKTDDGIILTSEEFPPEVPLQLFWQGRTLTEAVEDLQNAHNCRIVEKVATDPIISGSGEVQIPADHTELQWRKRQTFSVPENIDYLAVAFPHVQPEPDDTVAFRTLESFANAYSSNYLYYTEDPNDNVLIYAHLPYSPEIDAKVQNMKTYLEETNINHELEYFFRTKYLKEERLLDFDWTQINYIEQGGDLFIDVWHKPYITQTTNPLHVAVDQEYFTALVDTVVSGSTVTLKQMTDEVLNYDYPDGFEIELTLNPTDEMPEPDDRIFGVRAGLDFYAFGVFKTKPHAPMAAGGLVTSITQEYDGLDFQDGKSYTVPLKVPDSSGAAQEVRTSSSIGLGSDNERTIYYVTQTEIGQITNVTFEVEFISPDHSKGSAKLIAPSGEEFELWTALAPLPDGSGQTTVSRSFTAIAVTNGNGAWRFIVSHPDSIEHVESTLTINHNLNNVEPSIWEYDISVSPTPTQSPTFTLNVNSVGRISQSPQNKKWEVTFKLKDTVTVEVIKNYLKEPKFGTKFSGYSEAEYEALARQLHWNLNEAKFEVHFPGSTYWVGPIVVHPDDTYYGKFALSRGFEFDGPYELTRQRPLFYAGVDETEIDPFRTPFGIHINTPLQTYAYLTADRTPLRTGSVETSNFIDTGYDVTVFTTVDVVFDNSFYLDRIVVDAVLDGINQTVFSDTKGELEAPSGEVFTLWEPGDLGPYIRYTARHFIDIPAVSTPSGTWILTVTNVNGVAPDNEQEIQSFRITLYYHDTDAHVIEFTNMQVANGTIEDNAFNVTFAPTQRRSTFIGQMMREWLKLAFVDTNCKLTVTHNTNPTLPYPT